MGRVRLFAVWGVLALLFVAAYAEADLATDTEREELVEVKDDHEQTVALDDDVLSDRALITVTCRYVTYGVTVRRGRVNGANLPYNFNANPQRGTFRFTADEIGGTMEFVLQATNPSFPSKCISVSDSGFLMSCRASRSTSPWNNFGTSRRLWQGRRVSAVNQNPSGRTPVCATYKIEESSLDSTFEMEAPYFNRAERIWSSDEGNLVNLRAGVGAFQSPNVLPGRKPAIVDESSLRTRLNSNRGSVDRRWRDDAKVSVHRDTLVVNRLTSTRGFVDIYRRSRSGWSRVQTLQVPAPYNTVFTRLIGRKIIVRWNALMVLGYHRGTQKYWAYMYQRTAFNTPFVFVQRIAVRGNQNLKFGALQPNIALLARWMAAQTSPTVVSIFQRSGNGPSSSWSKVGQLSVRMQHAQPWVLGSSSNWLYNWGGSDKMQWNRERELVVANQRTKQVRLFFENTSGNWVQRQAWSNPRLFRTNWALATYEEFLFCTADNGYGRNSEIVQVFRKNAALTRYITTPSQILRQSDNRNMNTWRGFGNRMVVEDGVLLLSDYAGFDVAFHVFVLNRDTRQWNFFQRLEKRGSETPVQIQAVGYAHPNYAFAMVDGTPMGWFVPVTPALPCRTPPVDICFTMDRSGSISSSAYQAEKDFITGIVDRFEASPGGQVYRYGAVSFESRIRTISPLITSAGEFSRQVNNHPGPDGATNIADALRSCNTILNAGSGVVKILVLITDGEANTGNPRNDSGLRSLAASIKTTKTIISVGAGSFVRPSFLRSLASRSSGTNVPLYVSVTELSRFADFVPELAEEVCKTF